MAMHAQRFDRGVPLATTAPVSIDMREQAGPARSSAIGQLGGERDTAQQFGSWEGTGTQLSHTAAKRGRVGGQVVGKVHGLLCSRCCKVLPSGPIHAALPPPAPLLPTKKARCQRQEPTKKAELE